MIDEEDAREFEQVLLVALQNNPKTIAFTAPEPGSSSRYCARGIAEISARASRTTLLIDLADPITIDLGCDSSVQRNNDITEPARYPEGVVAPYSVHVDVFAVSWLDVGRTRETLAGFFPQYELVILNLPPLLGAHAGAVNPIAAAAACDHVFLVCQRGCLRRDRLLRAMRMASSGGCNFSGIISDERSYESPGREIAKIARRLGVISPKLAKSIERYSVASTLLN
jgi:hypothetical protein